MKPTFIFVLLALLASCQPHTPNAGKAEVAGKSWQSAKVWAYDSTRFDKAFLVGLANADYPDSIFLYNGYMVTGTDTIAYPALPLEGQMIKAASGNYVMQLQRVNHTGLEYSARWMSNDTIREKRGRASLSPMFFLAAEIMEDPDTEEDTGFARYEEDADDAALTILVSLDTNATGHVLTAFSLAPKKPPKGEQVISPVMPASKSGL